ncbi:MAG TPA: TAXI family TRAP transporter solute-binding subunit [Polyangiaceae bacterium]|nr:TAXI family TRAP transporter solute-binding subunit [Polyangiaceae bacterium]
MSPARADEAAGGGLKPPPLSRRGLYGRLAALGLLAALALGAFALFARRGPASLRIATGFAGGTALPVGRALAEVLREELPWAPAAALETAGGVRNAELVEAGEVELGLVPNNAPGGPSLRTLAPLYDEVLHVIVRDGLGAGDLGALRGRRVNIGQAGSATERLAKALFSHFRVDERALALSYLTHDEGADAFARGELDAVLMLTGLGAPAAARLLARPDARLLSFGDPLDPGSAIAGVRVGVPYLTPVSVPAQTYGPQPREPVGTLGVHLLLVARASLPDEVAFRVTKAVFEHKARLAEREPSLVGLRESFDRAGLRFAPHPGASQYYRRDEPPFILAWADTISLAITLALLGWSALAAVRAQRTRARKHRVDVYYADVQRASESIERARGEDELGALRRQLHAIRRRAFADLMAERLDANESFTIFQDYLRSELLEVEAALRKVRAARRRKAREGAAGPG